MGGGGWGVVWGKGKNKKQATGIRLGWGAGGKGSFVCPPVLLSFPFALLLVVVCEGGGGGRKI